MTDVLIENLVSRQCRCFHVGLAKGRPHSL